MSTAWDSIIGGVPAVVLSILGDLTKPLGLMITLGIVAFVVTLVAGVFGVGD